MRVLKLQSVNQLESIAHLWDRFSTANPFLSWDWLTAWTKSYGSNQDTSTKLFTLVVEDDQGDTIGIAPFYLETTRIEGRVLRFLGTGDACSEYLSFLTSPGADSAVLEGLAKWLTDAGADQWDTIRFESVADSDPLIPRFCEMLERRGMRTHSRPGPNCWRLDLPDSWEEFLSGLSKSHRKQVRRFQKKTLDTDRCQFKTVTNMDDLPMAFDTLVRLHQKRWNNIGEPGCFASESFTAFHQDVSRRFFKKGILRLHQLWIDDKVLAAEYNFVQAGTLYAYQSGVDPDARDLWPGHLLTAASLRYAITNGLKAVDLLRGDEPYKAHWRAKPYPTFEYRAIANHPAARVRHGVWLAGTEAKSWLKGILAGKE